MFRAQINFCQSSSLSRALIQQKSEFFAAFCNFFSEFANCDSFSVILISVPFSHSFLHLVVIQILRDTFLLLFWQPLWYFTFLNACFEDLYACLEIWNKHVRKYLVVTPNLAFRQSFLLPKTIAVFQVAKKKVCVTYCRPPKMSRIIWMAPCPIFPLSCFI